VTIANEGAGDEVVSIQVMRGVLVAAPHGNLTSERMAQIERTLSERIAETSVRHVVLDMSRIPVIDAFEFASLQKIAGVASILGSRVIFCGLRPGTVAALIHTHAKIYAIETAQDIDDALSAHERQQPVTTKRRRKSI
jgi:anti-anti-sigma regulatory factor